jgi:hypothetical protein
MKTEEKEKLKEECDIYQNMLKQNIIENKKRK